MERLAVTPLPFLIHYVSKDDQRNHETPTDAGNDEEGIVTVDGEVVFDYPNPMPDDFTEMTATFVATAETATIRFENDSPDGDKSIFLDDVTICDPPGTHSASYIHEHPHLGTC